jgi:translation elongation factor EF-Tu-like GTPase
MRCCPHWLRERGEVVEEEVEEVEVLVGEEVEVVGLKETTYDEL